MSQVLLFMAIGALCLGPIAYRLTERWSSLHAAVDGLSVVTVGSLALLDLAPHALTDGGPLALLPLLLGFFVPTWLHRLEGTGRYSDHILVGALLVHSAIETAALASASPSQANAMGLAIIAHQLPVGLAAYSVATSRRVGWLMIGALSLAMILGFAGGDLATSSLTTPAHAWLEALAAGSLLHVLSGHEYEPPPNYAWQNVERQLAKLSPSDSSGARSSPLELGPLELTVPAANHLLFLPREPAPLPSREAASTSCDASHCAPTGRSQGGHSHGGHSHGGHAHGAHAHGGNVHAASFVPPAESGATERRTFVFWSALLGTAGAARAAGLGALAGIGLVLVQLKLDHGHTPGDPAEHQGFLEHLFELASESAPALLLGYLGAALVALAISEKGIGYLRKGGPLGQSLRAIAFGLPLPICSCGVLPIYESLVRRGVPIAAGIAFLIATPELGLDAIALSWPLLGPSLAIARLVAAGAVALGAALIVARFSTRRPATPPELPEAATRPSLGEALRFGLVEMFDHTMPWIVFGLVVAALSEPLWQAPILREMPSWIQVPLLALIGMPLYVCASGATPLAAVAIQGGISPGAALAFLLTGPATNVTTFGILTRLHGRRTAILFGATVTTLAVIAGYVVNALELTQTAAQAVHSHASPSWLQLASLFLVGLLTVLSLLRQGPRGMLHQLTHAVH